MDGFKKFHVECVVGYLEKCEKQIKSCLSNNTYFKELESVFQRIDSLCDTEEFLYQLVQLNERYIELLANDL